MDFSLFSNIADTLQSWWGNIQDPDSTLNTLVSFFDSIQGILVFGFTIVMFLVSKYLLTLKSKKSFKKFLSDNYKESKIVLKKYYIPTRAQDIDPCEKDEIRDGCGDCQTYSLIDFFTKEAFTSDCQDKYFLVLADSGMGKTTFLLKLYQTLSKRRQAKVVMVPLSLNDCIKEIQKIEDKENTILLLDAFDENKNAMRNYKTFLSNLLNTTEKFRKVVITCRTQFFPDKASEPDQSGRIRIGTGEKKDEIVRKYISPLNDAELKKYLRKKYGFSRNKQQQALEIIEKVPALMARPIILSWIDFLCTEPTSFTYSFEIYRTIIDKWIEREIYDNVTADQLMEFSMTLSRNMCKDEISSMQAFRVVNIAGSRGINLDSITAKSRSLLNRDGNGNYKFAHRSFLEYFMAYDHFNSIRLPENISYLFRMTGYKRFLFEMLLDSAEKSDVPSVPSDITRFQKFHSLLSQTNHTLLDALIYWDAVKIERIHTHDVLRIITRFSYPNYTVKPDDKIMLIKNSPLHLPSHLFSYKKPPHSPLLIVLFDVKRASDCYPEVKTHITLTGCTYISSNTTSELSAYIAEEIKNGTVEDYTNKEYIKFSDEQ